jgi:hypothetical protein
VKKISIAVAVMVFAAGALGAYLWWDLREQRRLGGELAGRVAALESAPAVVATVSQGVVAEPPDEAVVPQRAPTAVAATEGAPPPPAPSVQQPGKAPAAAAMLEAMGTAEGQEFTRSMMRTMMAQMYPDVAEEVGLTAAETDKLFALISGQQGTLTADSMALMTAPADAATRRELQRKVVEGTRAQEREVQALLGSRYPKWEEYQGTATARQQVNQLRSTLAASGNPLSDAQADSLVTAFAAQQSRFAKEERAWANSAAAIESPDMMQETMQRTLKEQRKLVDVAAPHLESAQLAQFRRQVDQQERVLQATMGIMGGTQ